MQFFEAQLKTGGSVVGEQGKDFQELSKEAIELCWKVSNQAISPPDPARYGGEEWVTPLFGWDFSEGFLLRETLSLSLEI